MRQPAIVDDDADAIQSRCRMPVSHPTGQRWWMVGGSSARPRLLPLSKHHSLRRERPWPWQGQKPETSRRAAKRTGDGQLIDARRRAGAGWIGAIPRQEISPWP